MGLEATDLFVGVSLFPENNVKMSKHITNYNNIYILPMLYNVL